MNKTYCIILSFFFMINQCFTQTNYSEYIQRSSVTTNAIQNKSTSPQKSNSEQSLKSLVEEVESFEGFLFEPNCWTMIDADGDGFTWFQYGAEGTAYDGEFSAASASWLDSALTPDNYLVSPQLSLGENEELIYQVASQDPYFYEEKYGVYISTTGNDEEDFNTQLFVETLNSEFWDERTIDLSDYANMDVYLAFRHYDVTDQFFVKIDYVQLPGTFTNCEAVCPDLPDLYVEDITSMSAIVSWADIGTDYELAYGLSGFVIDEEDILSVASNSYLMQDLLGNSSYDVYVRNACLDDSIVSDWIMTSFTTLIAEEGESFEDSGFPPDCWTIIDADGDGYNWLKYGVDGSAYAGQFSAASSSWNDSALTADNYLVTPQLIIGENEVLNYHVAAQDPYFYLEYYEVLVSTTGNDVDDFSTILWEETLTSDNWVERNLDLSFYNGMTIYLAFRHYATSSQYYIKLDNIILPGEITNCITSISEWSVNEISLFPNPNSGIFSIQSTNLEGEIELTVFSISGQLLLSKSINIYQNSPSNVELNWLNNGIYFLQITDPQSRFTKTIKLIIKK